MAGMQLVAEGRIGGNGKGDAGDGNGNTPRSGRERTLRFVERKLDELDYLRSEIAQVYAGLTSGTAEEFEVGEALQAVRKGVQRLRKAREELIKQPLPGMD